MHPGFVVYNPATLLRLRAECGDNIGANLDPSHLFWQGIDVIEVNEDVKIQTVHAYWNPAEMIAQL